MFAIEIHRMCTATYPGISFFYCGKAGVHQLQQYLPNASDLLFSEHQILSIGIIYQRNRACSFCSNIYVNAQSEWSLTVA